MKARAALLMALAVAQPVGANAFRERGRAVQVADSALTITPPRDWNRLDGRPGKHAETWTLDGDQLNDVTFYADIASGEPLIRERHQKRAPLPKFRSNMLLVELPDLLAGTYRAYKRIAQVSVTNARPERFLGVPAVRFSYAYLDADELPRRGEGVAAIVARRLYMMTFDAPRLHYYDRTLPDFRALVETARLTAPPS